MSPVLDRLVPDGLNLFGAVTNAVVVGATLYVLDGSLGYAAAAAAGFLALHLSTDFADAVVGDYAGNALFGLVILAAAAYAATLTAPLWLPPSGRLSAGGSSLTVSSISATASAATRSACDTATKGAC